MSDPLRIEPAHSLAPSADADRDAKIESLLLAGLDQYFSSDFEQAIDIWTRALFLDRNHARARAYIERARSALAEQQRESEELLHTGVAAFERGELDAARQLLSVAVQRGGAHDVALAFLTRIERLHAAAPRAAEPADMQPRGNSTPVELPRRRFRTAAVSGALIAVSVAICLYWLAAWGGIRVLVPSLNTAVEPAVSPMPPVRDPLAVPRSSELALERGRSLFASGRPHDALRALELVRPTDPLRAEADQLKASIQRTLLQHLQAQP